MKIRFYKTKRKKQNENEKEYELGESCTINISRNKSQMKPLYAAGDGVRVRVYQINCLFLTIHKCLEMFSFLEKLFFVSVVPFINAL